MYAEQFNLLQKGDVIKGKRGDLRVIEKVSTTHMPNTGETYFITLLKLRSSWTRGEYTTYSVGVCGNFRPVKVKNHKIWKLDHHRIATERLKKHKVYARKKIALLKKQIAKLEKHPS